VGVLDQTQCGLVRRMHPRPDAARRPASAADSDDPKHGRPFVVPHVRSVNGPQDSVRPRRGCVGQRQCCVVLRTIGYSAWIEDTNGNEIDEKALKMAIGIQPYAACC
jgi:hypothetical protein